MTPECLKYLLFEFEDPIPIDPSLNSSIQKHFTENNAMEQLYPNEVKFKIWQETAKILIQHGSRAQFIRLASKAIEDE